MSSSSSMSRITASAGAPVRTTRSASRRKPARAHETNDILDGPHDLRGHGAGALRAIEEDAVDMARIGGEPSHLGRDGRESRDREVDEGSLEGRELGVAVLSEHVGL